MQPEPVVKRHPRWEDFFQPIEHPPPEPLTIHAPAHEPSPVEDTVQPEGAVGLTAFFAVVLATLLLVAFFLGSTVGRIGALVLFVLAVPVVVSGLRHPSRQRTR